MVSVDWQELLDLHVLRNLAKLTHRRWNLGIGYATADGREVSPPKPHKATLCPVIQSCAAGAAACAGTAVKVARLLGDQHRRGELGPGALTYTCHAGLQEVAVPIISGGEYVGCLIAGGFVVPDETTGADDDGENTLLETDRRSAPLELPADGYAAARARHPRLLQHEVSYLNEVMELCAEEIVAFQNEVNARVRSLERELRTRYSYDAIIGRSGPMQELCRLLDKVIDSDSTVLIGGENGTGKELIAKAIHYNSARKLRRFVVQNCSAFNDNLLDSELFGHRRGAFTGAIADKQGLFEVADGGTFFLDEVGDMSASLQVKLLRVLQEGTFTPVGDTEVRRVDVRIIAATNRDLKRMVELGQFREDLYYRLNVINMVLPPLRDRRDDIALLVEHFLRKHARGTKRKLSKGCLDRLTAYNWPGNVRELENEIERLLVLAGDEKAVGEELLSPRIRQATAHADLPGVGGLPGAVAALERTMIADALKKHGGNKSRAAIDLRVSRRNLIRLVQKYRISSRSQ